MSSTRREFLQIVALAAVPFAASGAGCSDDGGGAGSGGGAGGGSGGGTGLGTGGGTGLGTGDGGSQCSAVSVDIETAHAHSIDLGLDDVLAGAEKTYTFTGSHPHSITVTAAQFATIAAGGTVMVTSTPGGAGDHTHLVTIACSAVG